MLSIFGVTMVLLVGLIGRLYTDGSREWWSRQGGWAMIFVLGWLALFLVTFYIPPVLFWASAAGSEWIGGVIASGWLATTLVGVAAGAGKSTGKEDTRPWLNLVEHLAPYVFTLGIVVAVSTLVHLVVAPGGSSLMELARGAKLTTYVDTSTSAKWNEANSVSWLWLWGVSSSSAGCWRGAWTSTSSHST
ncbi:MAG: hypothetical protein WBO95_18550 [Candidatus Dechloromonas phosphoritropha]